MATILLLLLYRQSCWVSAVPITTLESKIQEANGNTTLLRLEIAPAWSTTSNVRSTADLLWTCLLTLFICVCTVLHLNVPPPGEKAIAFYCRKIKWVLISVFAPELSLAAAFMQWTSAKALIKELTRLQGEKEGDGRDKSEMREQGTTAICKFNMSYGYYAVMGGFTVDVSLIHNYRTRLTINPRAIVFLAKCGHFLEIDEQTIEDKSKANILAKSLVCVQVIWIVIQCIGREAAGYPISMLEIHVLVHVICTLCMYALWFKKPLDVHEPTRIDPSKFMEQLALLLLESPCNGDIHGSQGCYSLQIYAVNNINAPTPNEPEDLATLVPSVMDGTARPHQVPDSSVPILTRTKGISIEDSAQIITHVKVPRNEFYDGFPLSSKAQKRAETIKYVCEIEPGQSLKCGIGLPSDEQRNAKLSAKDIQRWTLASKAMQAWPDQYPQGSKILTRQMLSKHSNNLDEIFDGNIAKASLRELWTTPLYLFMLIMLPLIYGGLHLSAWSFNFPSRIEHIMWKAACIIVMAGIPIMVSILALMLLYVRFDIDELLGGCVEDFRGRFIFWAYFMPLCILLVLVALLYIFARVFLIIESFISIRYLPIGVYITINWANYIPHL